MPARVEPSSCYVFTMKTPRILALLFATALAVVAIAPAQAAHQTKNTSSQNSSSQSTSSQSITVSVYHQAVAPIAVSGSGIGEIRTFFAPIAVNGKAADGQYFTGTLTTMTEGMTGGQELRAANLAFVFGSEENQLIIGGISLYPATGATIAPGTKTVRPIIGGSGIYNGARGQVVSTNLGANGWTHVFTFHKI